MQTSLQLRSYGYAPPYRPEIHRADFNISTRLNISDMQIWRLKFATFLLLNKGNMIRMGSPDYKLF